MKHTPKPWIRDTNIIQDWDGPMTIVIFGPDGPGYGRVAQVYAECGRKEELIPTADLIAAAPELLEALENLVLEINDRQQRYIYDAEMGLAEKVIRKAKGS